MKRQVIVVGFGVLLLFSGFVVHRNTRPSAPVVVTLEFLHYTNDFSNTRSLMYKVADNSERSMAVFRLHCNFARANTGYHSSGGRIQLHLTNGWSADVNHSQIRPADIAPNLHGSLRGGWIYSVPVPAGTNGWRYSVPFAYGPNRPVWQTKAINLLSQVGFNIRDREYIITSLEITR